MTNQDLHELFGQLDQTLRNDPTIDPSSKLCMIATFNFMKTLNKCDLKGDDITTVTALIMGVGFSLIAWSKAILKYCLNADPEDVEGLEEEARRLIESQDHVAKSAIENFQSHRGTGLN